MALRFDPIKAAYDPDEIKDFTRDWTAEMDATEDTIAQAFFVLPQSALDASLEVMASSISQDGKRAIMWLRTTDPVAARDLLGTKVAIDHTVQTAGGRTLNETLILTVKEK